MYRIVVNQEAASRALSGFAQRGFADLMEILGTLVEGQTKRRIASEKTSPDGNAWPPLKARSGSILVDTGRLLGSISHTSTSNEAIVGTNVFYGPFHQYGTRKMPARPFMGVSAPNMDEIRRAVDAWVQGSF